MSSSSSSVTLARWRPSYLAHGLPLVGLIWAVGLHQAWTRASRPLRTSLRHERHRASGRAPYRDERVSCSEKHPIRPPAAEAAAGAGCPPARRHPSASVGAAAAGLKPWREPAVRAVQGEGRGRGQGL